MLTKEKRLELWHRVFDAIEAYLEDVAGGRVTPELDPKGIRGLLKPFDFEKPIEPLEAVDFVVESLRKYQTHTPHPRYYGLFNPAPTAMGIAADALVAAFNPQLAAWSHSPFAIEVEHHLVRAFGVRFGYSPTQTDGTFASGGAEANHTAVLAALVDAYPEYAQRGVLSLEAQPTLYVSSESHHSLLRAARLCGIGTEAVREVPVDRDLRMIPEELESLIREDRKRGFDPFLVAATAGTTNAGAIDPIDPIAAITAREGLWLHVDAAWGGAVALVPELRSLLQGTERADSITFDAHKWLSVPMAAGLLLTRHRGILDRTFRIENVYMPKEAAGLDVVDPYTRSIQWSRRFIGLKVFLSLAVAGWDGYTKAIRHQTRMGETLREKLGAARWEILNRTPLPLVCFVDGEHAEGRSPGHLDAIVREILSAGKAWISTTRIAGGTPVLRACITNYLTTEADIEALVQDLDWARKRVREL